MGQGAAQLHACTNSSMLLDEDCVCWNSNPMLHNTNLVCTSTRQPLSGATISRFGSPTCRVTCSATTSLQNPLSYPARLMAALLHKRSERFQDPLKRMCSILVYRCTDYRLSTRILFPSRRPTPLPTTLSRTSWSSLRRLPSNMPSVHVRGAPLLTVLVPEHRPGIHDS